MTLTPNLPADFVKTSQTEKNELLRLMARAIMSDRAPRVDYFLRSGKQVKGHVPITDQV